MMALLPFAAAGFCAGAACGLVPGLHTNTVSAFAVSLSLLAGPPFLAFLVAMTVAQSFFDHIPACLLGAADESADAMAALPAHRLFVSGRGTEAITLSCAGSLAGTLFALLSTPLLFPLASSLLPYFGPIVLFVLFLALAWGVLREPTRELRALSLLCILLASALGFLALKTATVPNAIVALVSGLFAAAPLLHALVAPPAPRPATRDVRPISIAQLVWSALTGTLAGALVSILPALGPSHAAFLSTRIAGKTGTRGYLMLLGALSSSGVLFAFFGLYYLGFARSGGAIALSHAHTLLPPDLWAIAGIALCTAALSYAAATRAAPHFARLPAKRIPALYALVLVLITATVWVLCGPVGLVAYLAASALGLFALRSGTHRAHLMAFLVTPTLYYYAFSLLF